MTRERNGHSRSAPMSEKRSQQCLGDCARMLPLTDDWFHRDDSRDSGFRSVCKECRAKDKRVKEGKKVLDDMDKYDRALINTLDLMSSGGSDCPHIAEVFQHVMRIAGGAQGYAKQVWATYLAANPGSATRQKILANIGTLMNQVTESGVAQVPNELLNDEDLQRKLKTLEFKLRLRTGNVIDEPTNEAPPSAAAG